MRTSSKLINKELGTDLKNHGIESVNTDGRCATNQQIIADVFNLLKTKRNPLYIRNKSVPRSKHFPPCLQKPVS